MYPRISLETPRRLGLLGAALASSLMALACGAPELPTRPPASALAGKPPNWCTSIESSLGTNFAERGFRCLTLPNFLVTGFYGTTGNPERSDFVNGCFAGQSDAAARLRMSVRPAGALAFSYKLAHRVEAGGGIDLAVIGPWAPRLDASAGESNNVELSIELEDAEIRVMSSVPEILAQEYQSNVDDARVSAALETCLDSLCAPAQDQASLVYTAKVLAAVPVIELRFGSERTRGLSVRLPAGVSGFELREKTSERGVFEIRAKEKLNVAALLEEARPAFQRAETCKLVQETRARRKLALDLRELAARVLAGRDLASVPRAVQALRGAVGAVPEAFSAAEARDLLLSLEALEGASGELGAQAATRRLCSARSLLETALAASSGENRFRDVITEVAQPLHRRLSELANEQALPCADPPFYRDDDGDGYGDKRNMLRAPKQPAGYVANALDCFDRNRDARPGQLKYFTRQRGDGSFDYDCDGKELLGQIFLSGGCKAITRFGIPIRCWAEAGWRIAVPGCGQEGKWLASCERSTLSCEEGQEQMQQQACR